MKILIEEEVVKQALDALGNSRQKIQYMLNNGEWYTPEQAVDQADNAITALRAALEAAETW